MQRTKLASSETFPFFPFHALSLPPLPPSSQLVLPAAPPVATPGAPHPISNPIALSITFPSLSLPTLPLITLSIPSPPCPLFAAGDNALAHRWQHLVSHTHPNPIALPYPLPTISPTRPAPYTLYPLHTLPLTHPPHSLPYPLPLYSSYPLSPAGGAACPTTGSTWCVAAPTAAPRSRGPFGAAPTGGAPPSSRTSATCCCAAAGAPCATGTTCCSRSFLAALHSHPPLGNLWASPSNLLLRSSAAAVVVEV